MQNIPHSTIESMARLKEEIYKIQCRNWIPSKSNGKGASGLTLEKLLGKKADRYVLPDYEKIEIKARNIRSGYPLSLFSCAFDNKPHEMYRLLEIGGYSDKIYPQFKLFQIEVSANKYKLNGKYMYKLRVNYNLQVVELNIYDKNKLIKVTTMSWSFYELKTRLERKLQTMAIVPVKSDKIDDVWYFKYYEPIFYRLKSFTAFLNLIENGKIKVEFKIGFDHSKEKFGDYLDRGTTFRIRYSNIKELFDIIYIN